MVMFTYLTCQFTISTGRGGCSLLGCICLIGRSLLSVSGCFRGNRKREASTVSPIGRPDCLLLSRADLIVRVGYGGVQAQGSVGQPDFLTLASWARGDGGQHVKLNLIPRFPSLLSCIFIGAPGAYHFWKFTKRLTAKINNKKCPLLKPLTLWNKPFAWALLEFFLQYKAFAIHNWYTTTTVIENMPSKLQYFLYF